MLVRSYPSYVGYSTEETKNIFKRPALGGSVVVATAPRPRGVFTNYYNACARPCRSPSPSLPSRAAAPQNRNSIIRNDGRPDAILVTTEVSHTSVAAEVSVPQVNVYSVFVRSSAGGGGGGGGIDSGTGTVAL